MDERKNKIDLAKQIHGGRTGKKTGLGFPPILRKFGKPRVQSQKAIYEGRISLLRT
jgi:hypothetical protein